MSVFFRRQTVFYVMVLLLVSLTGCGSGSSINKTEVQKVITQRILGFKDAVEAYNVEKMLEFLKEEGFELAISENGGVPYYKDYITLEAELKEGEAKQLKWRRPLLEGGQGYVLTMTFGTLTWSQTTENAAITVVPFTIKEKSEEIIEQVTDQGEIVFEMVKAQGVWLCNKMSIRFDALALQNRFAPLNVAKDFRLGLGFSGTR